MARDDWFRRTTWTSQDQTEFYARLARSRTAFHRAQYARIQALTLFDAGGEPLVRAALGILERIFKEYPETSQLESAHLQAAQCHDELGDIAAAIRHFRLAIEAHAHSPNFHSGVNLDFPWFIVKHGLTAHFDEALSVVQNAHLAFPIQQFKAATVRSRIALSRDDEPKARRFAHEALQAARATKSQFRHHQSLGLVGERYSHIVRELEEIAAP